MACSRLSAHPGSGVQRPAHPLAAALTEQAATQVGIGLVATVLAGLGRAGEPSKRRDGRADGRGCAACAAKPGRCPTGAAGPAAGFSVRGPRLGRQAAAVFRPTAGTQAGCRLAAFDAHVGSYRNELAYLSSGLRQHLNRAGPSPAAGERWVGVCFHVETRWVPGCAVVVSVSSRGGHKIDPLPWCLVSAGMLILQHPPCARGCVRRMLPVVVVGVVAHAVSGICLM